MFHCCSQSSSQSSSLWRLFLQSHKYTPFYTYRSSYEGVSVMTSSESLFHSDIKKKKSETSKNISLFFLSCERMSECSFRLKSHHRRRISFYWTEHWTWPTDYFIQLVFTVTFTLIAVILFQLLLPQSLLLFIRFTLSCLPVSCDLKGCEWKVNQQVTS